MLQGRLHAAYRKRKAPSKRQAPGQAEAEAEADVEVESSAGTVDISDVDVDSRSKLTRSHTTAQQSRSQPAVSDRQRDVTSGSQQEQISTQPLISVPANNQLQLQDPPIIHLRQQGQERALLDQDRAAISQGQQQSRQRLQRAKSTERDVEVELQSSEGQQGLVASQNDAYDGSDCGIIDGQRQQPAYAHRMDRRGTPQSMPVASQGAQSQQSCQRKTTPHTVHPIAVPPRRHDAQDGSVRGSCVQSMRTYHTAPDVDPDPEPSVAQGSPEDPDILDLSDYNDVQLRQVALTGNHKIDEIAN